MNHFSTFSTISQMPQSNQSFLENSHICENQTTYPFSPEGGSLLLCTSKGDENPTSNTCQNGHYEKLMQKAEQRKQQREEQNTSLLSPWNEQDYLNNLLCDGVKRELALRWIEAKKSIQKIHYTHYFQQKREFNRALYILQPLGEYSYNELISWSLERGKSSFLVGDYAEEIRKKCEASVEKPSGEKPLSCPQESSPWEGEVKFTGVKYDFVHRLMELGVEEGVAESWRQVRVNNRMLNTEAVCMLLEAEFRRAWEAFRTTPQECVMYALSRNSGIFTFEHYAQNHIHREKTLPISSLPNKENTPQEEVKKRWRKLRRTKEVNRGEKFVD